MQARKQKMTAFGTDPMTGERTFVEGMYTNKDHFFRDMIANGYKSVKVYNEVDMEHLEEILQGKFEGYQAMMQWKKRNGFI
jgi:ribosomal protein L32E